MKLKNILKPWKNTKALTLLNHSMYKKYYSSIATIFILFLVSRVYLESEYIKTSYAQEKLKKKLLEEEKLTHKLQSELHELQTSARIKKEVSDKLAMSDLKLSQIYSLAPKDQS